MICPLERYSTVWNFVTRVKWLIRRTRLFWSYRKRLCFILNCFSYMGEFCGITFSTKLYRLRLPLSNKEEIYSGMLSCGSLTFLSYQTFRILTAEDFSGAIKTYAAEGRNVQTGKLFQWTAVQQPESYFLLIIIPTLIFSKSWNVIGLMISTWKQDTFRWLRIFS